MDLFAKHWIGGQWIGSANGTSGVCLDPASGEEVGGFAAGGAAEAEQAIAAAREAFDRGAWAQSPRRRAAVLLEFADRLSARQDEIKCLLTRVNGKLHSEAAHEIAAGVSELRYYAGLARNIFGRMTEIEPGAYSLLSREAAGIAAIIVPWNAPVTLLVRSLAPALAAGCTVIIKPAPQTSLVNQMVLETLAAVEGLPPGVVNSVNESGSEVGQALVASPDVDVVSFTGSSQTGKVIMAAAAGTLKRLSLELGGKAPAIVFGDADLERTLPTVVRGGMVMAGQMCTAVSRVLVERPRLDEARDRLAALLDNLVVGPGDDPQSQMGPLIDLANRDRVAGLVADAKAEDGVKVVLAGRIPGDNLGSGAFITPTLLETQDLSSRYVQEELFGPILVLESFDDEEDAVNRANATRYGLAASIWGADGDRAQRVARHLRFGNVWINAHNRLFAEAETGGYKESGVGRLHGVEGLNDFLETKHTYMETGAIRG